MAMWGISSKDGRTKVKHSSCGALGRRSIKMHYRIATLEHGALSECDKFTIYNDFILSKL